MQVIPRDADGDVVLDGPKAMQLALVNNREYQTSLEVVYLQALALTGARFQFFPQLNDLLEPRPDLRQQSSCFGACVMFAVFIGHWQLTLVPVHLSGASANFFCTASLASSDNDFCQASRALSVSFKAA